MGDGTEPIDDDELLYRRVQLDQFDPNLPQRPHRRAFHPNQHDTTGISFFRKKYITPEQVARNERGKRYYVAVLRVGDLRAHGLEVVPRAEGHMIGHVDLPALRYDNRRTAEAQEAGQLLARKLCREVLGPLP